MGGAELPPEYPGLGAVELAARNAAAEIISRGAVDAALDVACGAPPEGAYTAVGHPDAAMDIDDAEPDQDDGDPAGESSAAQAADTSGDFAFPEQLAQLQA